MSIFQVFGQGFHRNLTSNDWWALCRHPCVAIHNSLVRESLTGFPPFSSCLWKQQSVEVKPFAQLRSVGRNPTTLHKLHKRTQSASDMQYPLYIYAKPDVHMCKTRCTYMQNPRISKCCVAVPYPSCCFCTILVAIWLRRSSIN